MNGSEAERSRHWEESQSVLKFSLSVTVFDTPFDTETFAISKDLQILLVYCHIHMKFLFLFIDCKSEIFLSAN